jgi:hypothetical protein
MIIVMPAQTLHRAQFRLQLFHSAGRLTKDSPTFLLVN